MSEWGKVRLGDVVDFLTGYPFKSDQYTDDESGIRLLRGDNIVQGSLRWDNVRRWPVSQIENHKIYFLQPGDVVLAMDRPWIEAGLKYSHLHDADCPALLVQRVTRLRGTSKIDGRFLRYVIGSADFTGYVLAVQTGTAVPHISGGQIKSYEFALPDFATQQEIGSVLAALDDKIELNRRMNATLEAQARALFRDWFVDFGPTRAKQEGAPAYLAPDLWNLFPATLDTEGKPEGWDERPLDTIAEFLNGLALQKFPAEPGMPSLPVIKIAELRSGVTANSNRASLDVPQKYMIEDGDFLFSWSGSLLAKFWTEGRGALNQHLFKVSSADFPAWFFSQWVWHHLEEFQSIAASKATTMGHIQRGHLSAAMTICPPKGTLAALGQVMQPLQDRVLSNLLESRTLVQTRDLLLPKLMSGEIRVREAERAIAAAF